MKYGVSYELNLIPYDQNIIDNYIKMENSPVGDAPETLCEEIIGWVDEHIINPIVNAAITIGEFIYNGLVAVGNFIVHAIEVAGKFLMEVWDTTVENVKRAVEVVKRVVDPAINWVAKEMRKVMSKWAGVIEKAVEGWMPIPINLGCTLHNESFELKIELTGYWITQSTSAKHSLEIKAELLGESNTVISVAIIYITLHTGAWV